MKAKTHNLKWHLFCWNFKAFKLLFTCIHISLASLSLLFKSKSFFLLLTWVLFTLRFNILVGTSLEFCPSLRDEPWWCTCFGAILLFIVGTLVKKYPWCMKIHFQFHFFTIWSISSSVFSIIAWKTPVSAWPLQSLPCF